MSAVINRTVIVTGKFQKRLTTYGREQILILVYC